MEVGGWVGSVVVGGQQRWLGHCLSTDLKLVGRGGLHCRVATVLGEMTELERYLSLVRSLGF